MTQAETHIDHDIVRLLADSVESRGRRSAQADKSIIRRGTRATPALVAILRGDLPDEVTGVLEGLTVPPGAVRGHAARLLSQIGDPAAIEPMLSVLVEHGDNGWEDGELVESLILMRAPVLEPALRAYASTENPIVRALLAWILVNVGGRDSRIFPALIEALDHDPYWAAKGLAMYGDRRAVKPIRAALDRYNPNLEHGDDGDILEAMEEALEDLGAPLTPGEREKYHLIIMEGYDRDEAARVGAEIDIRYGGMKDLN